MRFWADAPVDDESAAFNDYAAIWRAADKIVYSATLDQVTTERTTLERRFEPGAVQALKERGDVSIGGATLAAAAIKAGLVDEYHLYVVPYLAGGGTPAYPDGARAGLELLDQRRFASGVVYLRYRPRG
jgi:dihydrofolate reductase